MKQPYPLHRSIRITVPIFVLSLLFNLTSLFAQSIPIATGRYQIDNSLKLIVCNQLPPFPAGQPLPTLFFDKDYTFTQAVSAFEIGKPYKVKTGSTTFTLYFTNLPLVNIDTQGNQTISTTDDRTKGTFTLANDTDPLFTASMGIRIRGNSSRKFPKKSYNMELWKDPDGHEELETSLLGLREDSKWYLLAMYNEPLRLNNATSYTIWQNTHKLYYAVQEPDANPAIRTKYCDVFVNNAYFGVYMITEPMDRKQLKLKKTGSNDEVRGELYKSGGWSGATKFVEVPAPPASPTDPVWAEWEMDYPDPFWTNLYDLVKFVVNAPAEDFKTNVSKRLKIDNLVDYFIFLNLTNATDNTGNNQFLARYKENEPYFLIPWDMDATYGYTTVFTRSEEARSVISNGLFDRLLTLDPGGFKSKLRQRWFTLRQSEYSLQNLKNRFASNFNLLTAEGAYARETTKWAGTVNTSDIAKINSWLENRLNFLDEYFALFPENGPGVELNYFHGEVVTDNKNLAWSTLQEPNLKQFELESSTDGVNFSPLTTVAATGDAETGQTYQFVHEDDSPLDFYRLKIVLDNDQFTYSPFIQVGANSCPSPPTSPTISKNLSDITEGQTAILTASGCSESVIWSTGQTGQSVVVKPEVTTSYTAKCRGEAGCESLPSASVQINVFQNGSLPGSFEGYLGGVDCSLLRGWVWDSKKPNAGIYVEVLDNQNVIGTVIADDFRQDLKNAGKGNGFHGYTFSIPETLKDNTQHSLSIRVLGSNYILKDSPKKLTCPRPANQAPIKPAVSPLSATVSSPFTATLPAFFDADSPTLTYTLTGLPNGFTFAADTRILTGTPTAKGTSNLTYKASDGIASTSVTIVLTIKDAPAPPANLPPVKPAVSPLSATVNTGFTATLPVFTDPESAPLTYTLAGLPDALNFTASTRTITGTPAASAVLSLTYAASDGVNSTSLVVALTIADAPEPPENQPPVKPAVSPLSATVNAGFSATLPAFTDPDSDPLTYTLAGLPDELDFATDTRTINGTPTETATLSLTYTASDGPHSTSLVVTLTIVDASTPPVNLPPVKPMVSPLSATVNAGFTTTLPAFTDPESAPLTYTLAGLPDALDFAADTRTITGTPTETATLSLTYAASDGVNSTSLVVTLTIADAPEPPENLPPVKPTVSPLSATVASAFTTTLPVFTDPESAPLTYTLTGLPGGLNFTATTRTINGTPTASAVLSLTYSASDGTNSSSVTIPFTIANKPTPPTVTGNFEGYLDKVECGTIRGWVWDRDKPNTPLTVEFFANGQSIGTAPADIFRQDIKNAGKGNGYHVYNFTTPAAVKTGQTFSISAKVLNSTYTLKEAPKNLNCAPGGRLSVSADEAVSTDLIITPNPSSGEFEVVFHTATQTVSELSVLDELGRSWYRKTVEGSGWQRHKITLSGTIGTLVVGVRQGQQLRSRKILIVR
ncbi:CotH kinase family protein [Larkinella rosea]|uniref:Dystroglycan-type cadherin-like domain-containing protein n=1 Tax=Larkinella rosea TaxID=2025312 RepID=A0A3P1B9P1_9BACT|nr:CotH kinase family protein [Larkinella rosea]RRA97734.1 hypothetical protein EHT25_32330 [Larkinella rosea]